MSTLGDGLSYGLQSSLKVSYDIGSSIGSTLSTGVNFTTDMGASMGNGISSMIGLGYTRLPDDYDSDDEYYHENVPRKEYVKKGKTITYNGTRSK